MGLTRLWGKFVISQNEAVVCTLVGTGAILVGIFNKTFYAAKGLSGGTSGKQIPRWQGRLIFLLVGGGFLFFGIYYFISKAVSE
jgi:hypothetical protein